ncbi:hypothetical protein IFR05_011081 [Cadophora sp. M221]|nr:hypothetical protein IFR05_011081 [Cadophora sp. M221]
MHTCPHQKRGPTIPKHVAMDVTNQIRQSGGWTSLYKDWESKKLELIIQGSSLRYETAASAEVVGSPAPATKRTTNPFQQSTNHAPYSCISRKLKQNGKEKFAKRGTSKPKPAQSGAIFPFDIFFMIAKHSNIIDLTSLGLTSSDQYAVLRQFHPEPLPLLTLICRNDPDCPGQGLCHQLNCMIDFLHHRVGEWLGPKYFLSGNSKSVVFLNSEVYDTLVYLLPNPQNKGEDWYEEAIRVIAASYSSFEDMKEWTGYWKKFKVFRDNRGTIKRERKSLLRKRGGRRRRAGEKKFKVEDKLSGAKRTEFLVGKSRRKIWTRLGKPRGAE